MNLSDIHFKSRISLERHPRYLEFRRFVGLRDFAAYREVFERGWAETSIMCGEFVRIEQLFLSPEEPPYTPLVNMMGVNDHAPRRMRLVDEFLSEYDRLGWEKFMREAAFNTAYVRDLQEAASARTDHLRGLLGARARWRQRRQIKGRIHSFLNLYENMKRFGKLVGGAHILHVNPPPLGPYDVPWAIDYCGYVKLREGAHRRAAAHYLHWETIPTLVFEFDRTTTDSLNNAHPYIRDNFHWFVTLIWDIAQLDSQMLGRS